MPISSAPKKAKTSERGAPRRAAKASGEASRRPCRARCRLRRSRCARAVDADVVVVRAEDHDGLGRQARVGAGEDADHVRGRHVRRRELHAKPHPRRDPQAGGGRGCHRTGDEIDRRPGRLQRRQRVRDDQERHRAALACQDELLEPEDRPASARATLPRASSPA